MKNITISVSSTKPPNKPYNGASNICAHSLGVNEIEKRRAMRWRGIHRERGGGKMNVGVLLWTSLESRFSREFNSPG